MLTLQKTRLRNAVVTVLLLFGFSLTTCDGVMDMGLGPTVDLEPPTIVVTGILLPDGTLKEIEENDSQLLIGPGILFGKDAILMGEAWDNKEVVSILVQEVGPGAGTDGTPTSWNDSTVSPKKEGGWQSWTIPLDNIKQGERVIRVVAQDKGKNVGPESVKQLTLLVDTNDPFVEDIVVERKPGIQVWPQPRARLQSLDTENFEFIDYFQNETFSIRATIRHDFALSDVSLNFVDENGQLVFNQGLKKVSGTNYTPKWDITHEDMVKANAKYATGRHYMNVLIIARAEAGHTGRNEDVTNLRYSVCWWPESDKPKARIAGIDPNEVLRVEQGGFVPVNVFDDDNIGRVFAAVVDDWEWEKWAPGTDDQKMELLYDAAQRDGFHIPGPNNSTLYPLKDPVFDGPAIRSTVLAIDVGETRGLSRLIVLVEDKKDDGKPGVWGHTMLTVDVFDESVPFITLEVPEPMSMSMDPPQLVGGTSFTLGGQVQNLDPVTELKLAWIPDNPSLTPVEIEAVIRQTAVSVGIANSVTVEGIKIWSLPLQAAEIDMISGKEFAKQKFEVTFNLFDQFPGKEKEGKYFSLYTYGKSEGNLAYEYFYFMPYDTMPIIEVVAPAVFSAAPHTDINFDIRVTSDAGVGIKYITLAHDEDPPRIVTTVNNANVLTATTRHDEDEGYFSYVITTEDVLGFTALEKITIAVEPLPQLTAISTSHMSLAQFSGRDTVTIQAEFVRPVGVVGTPRLRLAGITTSPAGGTRYADYTSGSGTNRLNFTYTPATGDISGGLQVDRLEFNGGDINADWTNLPAPTGTGNNRIFTIPAEFTEGLTDKGLRVNAVAPRITSIMLYPLKTDGDYGTPDANYPNWLRVGHEMEIHLTADKHLKQENGTPQLSVPFSTTKANFVSLTNNANDTCTLVFRYKVEEGDQPTPAANPAATVNSTNCFDAEDLQMILDTVGKGNYLVLSPTALTVSYYNSTLFSIDGILPNTPSIVMTNATSSTGDFRITVPNPADNGNGNVTVQYTYDNGSKWNPVNNPYTFQVTALGRNLVTTRTIDRAGNVSASPDAILLDLGTGADLVAITCDNPSGAYGYGERFTFNLIFSGEVTNIAGTTIVLAAPAVGNMTTAQRTITFPASPSPSNKLTAEWTASYNNIVMDPVAIESITLNGVRRTDGTPPPGINTAGSIGTYNTQRDNLAVITLNPTVTAINGTLITTQANMRNVVVNGSQLVLTFSHEVFPENGTITIRPADGWYIPPVLSNEDYSTVASALAGNTTFMGTGANSIPSNYTATTHGLIANGSAYIPDISTKYVLNFNRGITGNAEPVTTLRNAFDAAEFRWQKFESSNGVKVVPVTDATGSTVNIDARTKGSRFYRVELDNKLFVEGRQWRIIIEGATTQIGAFRDKASNQMASWDPIADYIWSQRAAAPVIRVNRTAGTTNHPTNTPAVNVDYRIDCETPGATLRYGTTFDAANTAIAGVAVVNSQTNQGSFQANNSPDGPQNSNNADATVAQLDTTMSIGNPYATMGATLTIGDGQLNTARKDYIVATATHTSLNNSNRGMEGAFKTVIVYRNMNNGAGSNGYNPQGRRDQGGGAASQGFRYIKFEATTSNGGMGVPTISGFPSSYNDMTGEKSYFFYRNFAEPNTGNNSTDGDWVFISWEFVSNFWQVAMGVRRGPGDPWLDTNGNAVAGRSSLALWNGSLSIYNPPPPEGTGVRDDGNNPWTFWSADWQIHTGRKYGNVGLRIHNNN